MSPTTSGTGARRRRPARSADPTIAMLVGFDVVVAMASMLLWYPPADAIKLLALGLLILMRWRLGIYRERWSLSALDELPRALEAALIAGGIYAVIGMLPDVHVTISDVARLFFLGIALGLLRGPVYAFLRYLRRHGVARARLLLVGGGVVADRVAGMAQENLDYGLDLAGRIPDLADVDLPRAAEEVRAGEVLIAFSRVSQAREVFEIRRGLAVGLRIMAVPRYFDLIAGENADDHIFGVPVLRLGVARPTFGLALKRGLDITWAAAGLLVVSPFLLVAGILVKRETGGAMLFRQERIGRGGRAFELLKLQTMRPAPEGVSDTTWTVPPSSDQIGPVGSFLRRTSIDELPQLWNILRGDMSFVGPRPERPYFAEQFREEYPHYADRMRMSAGLTGLAQIHDLRGDTSIDDRARFDNRYSDNWSLWSDIKIMLKTVPKVMKGSGN